MRVESNIILGQKMIAEGKVRMHWMIDEEYFPVKPASVVSIDQTKKIIPLEEKWLKGKKESFSTFTIPFYDYVYMKDFEVADESYIVQPFSNDLVVIDIEINEEYIEEGVLGGRDSAFIQLPKGLEGQGLLINDFKVVGGFNKEEGKPYDKDKVMDVDLKVGFNEVWKEDLEMLLEAFYYTLSVTEKSIENIKERGDSKSWGKE